MPLAVQASFGPSFGHCLSSPTSADLPSRFGPRHWYDVGVSGAALSAAIANSDVAKAGRRNKGRRRRSTAAGLQFIGENSVEDRRPARRTRALIRNTVGEAGCEPTG